MSNTRSANPPHPWVYYCPFAYFLSSRLVTYDKVISWLCIYPLPILLGYLLFSVNSTGNITEGVAGIESLLLAFAATYCLYELGYLQNDTVTVDHEDNPTLRLNRGEKDRVKQLWVSILATRVSTCLAILMTIYQLNPAGALAYVLSLLTIVVVFPVYNLTRGKINVPLHFILVCCRFCGPALLIIPDATFFIYLVLAFPLINLIERGAEGRYGIVWLQKFIFSNRASGRYWYYLLVTLLWAASCFIFDIDLQTTWLFIYFFLYRFLSPILMARLYSAKRTSSSR